MTIASPFFQTTGDDHPVARHHAELHPCAGWPSFSGVTTYTQVPRRAPLHSTLRHGERTVELLQLQVSR